MKFTLIFLHLNMKGLQHFDSVCVRKIPKRINDDVFLDR